MIEEERVSEIMFHPLIQRNVRAGSPQRQGISSYSLATDAIATGQWLEARALIIHCRSETRLARKVYPEWIGTIRNLLIREGIAPAVLAEEEDNLLAKVAMPDGSFPDTDRLGPLFDSAIDDALALCDSFDSAAAAALEQARQDWVVLHDRATDFVSGLLDVVFRHLGEDRIPDVWDELMADWYQGRDEYDPSVRPWAESLNILLPDTTESLRGHMTGLNRAGDIEVIEEPDRWVFRFEPCGSGGRTIKGDPGEGSPPRPEPPYNFAVTTKGHDWSWGKAGVCLYCVHCCQLQERVPIEKFGVPVRVVEPPIWPRDRETGLCTWYVYKDPALIPAVAYSRVGATPPDGSGPPGDQDAR